MIETCKIYGYRSVKVLFNNDMKQALEHRKKTVNTFWKKDIHVNACFPLRRGLKRLSEDSVQGKSDRISLSSKREQH